MTKVINYEFIELIIPTGSTGTRYFYPDQPNLRFVSLMNLEAYQGQGGQLSVLSGVQIIQAADFYNAYLVLYYNDKEAVSRIPLMQLNRNFTSQQNNVFQTYPFAGQQIIWAKSYVQFSTPPTGVGAAPMSVPLGVYWA